jgi:hypothetical protein
MRFFRTATILFIFLSLSPLFASLSLSDPVGKWETGSYMFILNRNYSATVIIYINRNNAYVFNGVYTVDDNDILRVNISQMKSGPKSEIFSRKGFTKTASSRFLFKAAVTRKNGKKLILKPKEIVIDGNNSDGYFEKEIILSSIR